MKKVLLIYSLLILFIPTFLQAETVNFEEQYTYDASDADSKLTCRAISLLEVKKILLEKLGTYLEAKTEVVNFQLTRDEVTTLTAGIIKTEIVNEKWDGKTYELIAKIEADPDAVAKSIDELRKSREGREMISKLKNVNARSIEKIEELKDELERVQKNLINLNSDYSSASKVLSAWELYESGLQFIREERHSDAVSAFNEAIEIQPNYIYFYQRGKVHMKLKHHENAIQDFNKVLSLNPDVKDAYFQRGRTYRRMGKKKTGLNDIRKAAELGSGNAVRWLKMKGKLRRRRTTNE
ncbi:MAG: tetratricopeptide repeat protein [Nitrospirota bacterium]